MSDHTDPESALRARLAHVTSRYSQAEIARRLGRPLSTVNNYLHGTRVPAALCADLVEHLGVNPAWLLAGEGEPFLADITPDAAATRDRLLELVRVMRSLSRLRLGALAGRPDRKALREATDALSEYENLRAELAGSFGRSLRELLGDAGRALQSGEVTRANGLLRAAVQLAPLAGPGPEQVELEHLLALSARMTGNEEVALAGNARAFRQSLPLAVELGGDFYAYAYNYARSLFVEQRPAQALDVCQVALALVPRLAETAPQRALVELAAGWALATQGKVLAGLVRMAVHAGDMPEALRAAIGEPRLVLTRLMAGVIEFEHALAAAARESHVAEMLAQWTIWSEYPAQLYAVFALLQRFQAGGEVGEERRFGVLGLISAFRDAAAGRLQRLPEPPAGEPAFERFNRLVMRTQALRLAGREAAARKLMLLARRELHALPQGVQPRALVLGAHYRSVLRLLPARTGRRDGSLREEALRYFRAATADGCQCFASLAD